MIVHTFEYHLPNTGWIFDLALFDLGVLVEFDERYHFTIVQRDSDALKDSVAQELGWEVCRVNTNGMKAPYPIKLLNWLFDWYN